MKEEKEQVTILGKTFNSEEERRKYFREELRKKLCKPSAIRPVRKCEVSPGTHSPVAISPVQGLDGRAIGPSEVLMEIGGATQRLQSRRIAAVLPIECNAGHGEVVVA